MASIAETIRSLIDSITGIFRRKRGLESLSKDDLITQKTILEQNENKILREMERLEVQKTKLFEEAKQASSESVRRAKARQIRDIDQRIRGLQSTLTPLGKRISILGRLIAQHDTEALPEGVSEVADVLRRTDTQEIQNEIDAQLAADLMQDEKLDDMAESFNVAQERDEELYEEDEEVLAIMAQIESAAAMEASMEEAALLKEQSPAATETTSPDQEQPMKE